METMPLWFLLCGILSIAIGFSFIFMGMSRLIGNQIARQIKDELQRR